MRIGLELAMSVERPADISCNADIAQAEIERLIGDADDREKKEIAAAQCPRRPRHESDPKDESPRQPGSALTAAATVDNRRAATLATAKAALQRMQNVTTMSGKRQGPG